MSPGADPPGSNPQSTPMTEKLAAQFDRLMTDTPFIKDLDDLEQYLQLAIKLEHFTLPLYLTAYWSLRTDPNKPDPNLDLIATIFRTIAFEEMLHMGLVSNMVVAIGRRPKI